MSIFVRQLWNSVLNRFTLFVYISSVGYHNRVFLISFELVTDFPRFEISIATQKKGKFAVFFRSWLSLTKIVAIAIRGSSKLPIFRSSSFSVFKLHVLNIKLTSQSTIFFPMGVSLFEDVFLNELMNHLISQQTVSHLPVTEWDSLLCHFTFHLPLITIVTWVPNRRTFLT